jgi:hypothetical protein
MIACIVIRAPGRRAGPAGGWGDRVQQLDAAADDLGQHRLEEDVILPGDDGDFHLAQPPPAEGTLKVFRRINAREPAAEDHDLDDVIVRHGSLPS